jgi:uncharacterized protein DUF6600/FecR-like protein
MLILAGALTAPTRAQDPDDQKRGVARISVVQGDVSVQRGDSGEWVAATVNTPLLTNDHIATGANSRAEVQFDSANVLRVGGEAEVSLTELEYARYQMAVAHGTVTYRVLRNSNIDVEVDTPSVSVRPSHQGAYRIVVTDSGETEVSARSGEVEVFSPHGSQWVRSGQTLMARGSASDPEFQVVRALPADEWDRWSDNRDQTLTRSASGQYVGPGIYGTEDLDPYGNWVNVPGYGYAWHPLAADDWAPYRQGRWVWEDWYGWTWVSYEPWGWAPYHYGRWFYEPAYGWCWYPGIVTVRHYWSPAMVAFFGFGGGGVSVAFGNVGWVPLAPYEVFHPWWGRGYYGGPAYVNRSVNITNINITNVYRNARVQNGFTAVSGTDFRAGRFSSFVRPSAEQLRTASSVRGPIPVAPERANLQFSERQSAFAPRPSANTRFFTRQQPNPAPRVPFNEQRRSFGAPGVAAEASVPNRGGFSQAAPQIARPQVTPQAPAIRNDGGWQRFGDPRSSQPAARTEPAAPVATRGWGRFGGDTNVSPRTEAPQPRQEFDRGPSVNRGAPMPEIHTTTPRSPFSGGNEQPRYSAPARTQALPISPPVVRERTGGNGGGGGFSAPRGGNNGGSRNSGGSGNSSRGGNRSR